MDHKQQKPHTISDLDPRTEENPPPEPQIPKTPKTHSDEKDGASQNDPARVLAVKTEECQALQDKYLRLAAEFENYKRIAQRDQREYSRFANEELLKELLTVVDNLERAIRSAKISPDSNTIIEGVQLTLKHFLETLSKFGVRQIVSLGQPFDPFRHQAVTRVENAEVPDNTVMEEFQKGYLLHERVLRPAMVAVSTSHSPAAESRPTRTQDQESDKASPDDRYES